MPIAPLNAREQRRHRRRNLLQSLLLLGGMALLLTACGWIIAGLEGVLWAVAAGALGLWFSPRLSPRLVLRLYKAVPLPPPAMPELHRVLAAISARAGLARPPELQYIPSASLNAFAVGTRKEAAIAVTDGLLRSLNLRQLAAVLAHEISHIRNNDIWVMGLADVIGRMTGAMALFGLLLLLFSLPLLVTVGGGVPWLLVLVLLTAPVIGTLLQLALSRTREFDADLDAAGLTGDPAGLAEALAVLERVQGGAWERLFAAGRRSQPSVLRTHPDTAERVRRLMALRGETDGGVFAAPVRVLPVGYPVVARPPRRRITGIWY